MKKLLMGILKLHRSEAIKKPAAIKYEEISIEEVIRRYEELTAN